MRDLESLLFRVSVIRKRDINFTQQSLNFTIKVNVKKQRRFDRSTVIPKLKSEKVLNALKYIQTIIKMLIRY